MEKYIQQLVSDIEYVTTQVPTPWAEAISCGSPPWKSAQEDLLSAPRKSLEEWTDIRQIELPPEERLTADQLHRLLEALLTMLSAYNCVVVFQTPVPERYQYRVIRERFQQDSSFLQFHINFFEFCEPGQTHKACALGEYCQCHYMEALFTRFSDEHTTPKELKMLNGDNLHKRREKAADQCRPSKRKGKQG